ncbi:long-chain-fatty-acid--CoA ligase ACSBG2-like isoform X2 [Scyliorhinus canicula]|uniref:long-chain-fatty-acid--CoA ligase ACSBG2-like isoform X2 n=1 Tax=Scyliorhinus canicula TaxID=7830 RepID=UPI0018F4653A|nr:long-chain-fatty-acid--CoA ligase ACSBG2-like isoform X2 [Scyliorhinus canicula]
MEIPNDSPVNPEQVTSAQERGNPADMAQSGDFNNSNSKKKKAGAEAGTSRGNKSFSIKLAPATNLWTTQKNGAVKLRMEETCCGGVSPLTVAQMFQETVNQCGDHVAIGFKQTNQWETLTFAEYYGECRKAAKSFLKLGLERFHGVGILGFNSPEWLIANVGAVLAGGLAVGIYATNTPEACKYVAQHCEANILVVENAHQLKKILEIQNQLPHLKAIIQYKFALEVHQPNIYMWKAFMKIGEKIPDAKLDEIMDSQMANQCCTLIYTSGTTGIPKAVMLSQDNLTWTANTAGKMVDIKRAGRERVVSFLPMSHVAAQMMDIWIPMKFGAATYFADPDALKGSLVNTLKEVRPTAFLGVPRVWEKIEEKMKETSAESSTLKRKIAIWAKGIGLQAGYNNMYGNTSVPCGFALANSLVFKKVRVLLGLDNCTKYFTGAAPITKDTLEFFLSLGIPIFELYGMSESTGPHTVSQKNYFRITSCGKTMEGCKTKVDKPDELGTGEICFWGRNIFMGYLNMDEQTQEAIDKVGWLHSGDLGKFDEDDFLYITGRIKELIITAGGENIAPIPIEDSVKSKLPIISNAMLIGDKRKFLSMLLTLKPFPLLLLLTFNFL